MHSCLIIILKTSVTVWEADLWPGCTWWPRRAPPCSRPSPWPCKHLDFRSDAGWAHPSPSGSGRWPEPRRRGPPGTWCYWCRPVGKELSADSNWMEGKDESTREHLSSYLFLVDNECDVITGRHGQHLPFDGDPQSLRGQQRAVVLLGALLFI